MDEMKEKRYAIAATMTKTIPGGMNILTSLQIVDEVHSEEEAIGAAVLNLTEQNPDHSIHKILAAEITEQ